MELTATTLVRSLRPARRRGFPADLALGFYLYAQERMTYIHAGRQPDQLGWFVHRFVSFDGRLIHVPLPPKARLFIWPAGRGPRPIDSVACRTSVWARLPSTSLAALDSRQLGHIYRLWEQFGRRPAASGV